MPLTCHTDSEETKRIMTDIGITDIELQKLTSLLAQQPKVQRAVVYGSRAKGCSRRFSDIDLTLIGETLTKQDLCRIAMQIDDLLLPYEFDLSLYSKLTNEALVAHINRVGKTIYNKKE